MTVRFHSILSRIYPVIAGCIFLGLGAATLIHPEILGYYAINLDQPSARTAVRAMIGGGEIGIAFILLLGGYMTVSSRQRSLIAAVIFIFVGLSRLLGAYVEGIDHLTIQPFREAAIEITLGALGFWAARCSDAGLLGGDVSYPNDTD